MNVGRKSKFLKSAPDFRNPHKQLPQQSRSVIFNHCNNWALVNCQVAFCIPVVMNTESINKTIFAPYLIA